MAKKGTHKSTQATLDATTRICVLHGAEQMRKQEAYDQLRTALTDVHGDIEPILFDGQTVPLADVLDELRTFSLMQSHKLVVVDEADQFVKRFREAMERYAKDPVDSGTLVLRSVRWNKGNLDKAIAKVGAIVKCDALKPYEAVQWVTDRARRHHGTAIDRDAAQLLVERLGVHLMKLDTELGKLSVMAGQGNAIDSETVMAATGRASDEQAWVVQEAVLSAITSARTGSDAAGRMIEKVRELLDVAGQDAVPLTWAMADLCRKFVHAGWLKQQGMNDAAIGKALKIWPPPRAQMFVKAIGKLNAAAAARLYDNILNRDARCKSGFGNAERHLECFCVDIGTASA